MSSVKFSDIKLIMSFSVFAKKFDWPLFVLVLSLIGIGLVTLYGIGPLARDFFYRQLTFLAIGSLILVIVAIIDYRIFKNFSFVVILLYVISLIFLFGALQSSPIRAVHSWIVFRTFQFGPAELAKLALIILLAKYFSQKHVEIYRINHVIVSFLYTALPAFLVFIQPDIGSASIFFVIWFLILLAAGIKRQHVIAIVIFAMLFSSIAWIGILEDYQKDRITSFLNPFLDPQGAGYNVIQSRISVGSGSWFGTGWGKGTQSSRGFLPEAHTDFIFASFAEQFGLVGVVILISLILALIWRILYICMRAGNNFSKLFGVGFIFLIGGHILLSMGINIGLLPVTGIPFSFLSYGGSHLLTLMAGIGIIQSIKIYGRYG